MNGVSSPGGLATSSATSIEEGSFCLMLDPSTNPNVGAITMSLVGSIDRTEYDLVSPADSTSTWLWYDGITSSTNGIDFSLFTTALFNVIFAVVGAPTPPIPGPPVSEFSSCCVLETNNMFGAKLLNCSLKNAVNPEPIPLTATSRLLPTITMTIVNA